MRLTIRPAEHHDYPALVRQFGSAQFLRERLDSQLNGHGILLVALLDEVPVGHVYLWLGPADEAEIRAELPGVPLLNRLVVTPAHRNRGIGSALLAHAERALRDLGHRRVALGVGVRNRGAIRLYERHEYSRWPLPPIVAPAAGDLGLNGVKGTEAFTVYVKDLDAVSDPPR